MNGNERYEATGLIDTRVSVSGISMDESPAYSATMIPDALESNEAYGVAEHSAENND